MFIKIGPYEWINLDKVKSITLSHTYKSIYRKVRGGVPSRWIFTFDITDGEASSVCSEVFPTIEEAEKWLTEILLLERSRGNEV